MALPLVALWRRSLLFDRSERVDVKWVELSNHQPPGSRISQPRHYYDSFVYRWDHSCFYQTHSKNNDHLGVSSYYCSIGSDALTTLVLSFLTRKL